MAKPSESIYKLIWATIIIGGILWASIMFIGLAMNPITLILGVIILSLIAYVMYILYHEQKSDKESEHYSKHIDK